MDDEDIVEEGEIVDDDSDNNYTPLERPPNYSSVAPMQRFPPQPESDSDEDDLALASDSGSDSDCTPNKAKKPRMKLKPKPQRQQNPKQKKYDIWSTRVQEDVLSETLNICDVSFKDRSRDVESYDYTLSASYKNVQRTNNKRSRDDRKNKDLRLVNRTTDGDDEVRGSPRTILDLTVTLDNTPEEIASDMANKLCEEKEELLVKIINIAGKQKAFDVFKETKRIESEGGMLIMNQTRRRTPGGIFLFLMRHDSDLTEEQVRAIFDEDRQKFKMEQKVKKKQKAAALKQKNASSRANKDLPDLLTKAELCVQKLAAENNRTRKESTNLDVINPPPTPETDCHENSGDGTDHNDDEKTDTSDCTSLRKLQSYEVDFLDLSTTTMDTF